MSTPPNPINNPFEMLYARWRASFLLRIQLTGQLISFVSASIGVVYVLINVDLTRSQAIHLLSGAFLVALIANLLLPVYARFFTVHARRRLSALARGEAEGNAEDEELAWKEVILLPWRSAIPGFLTSCVLVPLCLGIYMERVGGTGSIQTMHIVIGSLVAGLGFTLQNTMFLDRSLAPARIALLPGDPAKQTIDFSIKLQTRLQMATGVLALILMLMVAPFGYQKLLEMAQPGADQAAVLRDFVVKASITGVVGIVVALIVASLEAYQISDPANHIIRVMKDVEAGQAGQRASVSTSDETAEMTLRLNRMLDRLEGTQSEMEKRVRERTTDLARRAAMLQAATQVSRQAVAAQNLDILLQDTANLISDRFGYAQAGIFLVDQNGDYAVLHAASGDGQKLVESGYRLPIGRQGTVGAAAYLNRPQVASGAAEAHPSGQPEGPDFQSEAALPLSVQGKVIGVLDIQSNEPEAFPSDVIELLQTMADQVALAIQNARLLAESQEALQKLETTTLEGVRRTWGERVKGQKRSYVYTPLGLAAHAPLPKSEAQPAEPTTRFDVPIMLRGQKIGGLSFQRKGKLPWPDTDRTLAVEVASQIGLALENTRLLEDARQRAVQEQSFSELTAKLSQSLDPETIMQTAVRELRQFPNVREVSVFIAPPEADSAEKAPG